MRIKAQYLFVIAVAVVVTLYFVIRGLFGGHESVAQAKPVVSAGPPSVQVKVTPEAIHQYDVVLRGRTQATRAVIVRSETAGVVAAAPILQGTIVQKGAVLCKISVDARQAALDQAKANLRSNQLQQQAMGELARKGFRSQTQLLAGQANLDAATATVRQAEIALAQVNIRAPFTGVFDQRAAEVGAYLSPGQPCGTMIELDPLLVVGDVPETEAGKLRIGQATSAKLVSGQTISGRIRYVAHDADPQTRTYHLEVIAPNPRMDVRSGLSAELRIASGAGPAHLVPVSSLVLDSAGRQGVRYIDGSGRVAFAPVTVLEETADGIWVGGMHGEQRVITVGQSYVADGQKVRVALAR
jgi:multidrug efflux system membrane fusion protein